MKDISTCCRIKDEQIEALEHEIERQRSGRLLLRRYAKIAEQALKEGRAGVAKSELGYALRRRMKP